MSFDVFFEPCRYDGTTDRRVNPFTKQVQDVPRNTPLSEVEVAAVSSVLDRAGAQPPDEHGCRVVRFPDGGSAEIFTNELSRGCMFSIRGVGVTPALAQLLFDVMVAGGWVLMPAGGGDDVVIAPNAQCTTSAPSFYGRVVVAESAREVAALLEGGFDAWKRYRDSVIRS